VVDVASVDPDTANVAAGTHEFAELADILDDADTTNTPLLELVATASIPELDSLTLVESDTADPDTVAVCGLVRIRDPLASVLTVLADVP
jgi:hypothetical protein